MARARGRRYRRNRLPASRNRTRKKTEDRSRIKRCSQADEHKKTFQEVPRTNRLRDICERDSVLLQVKGGEGKVQESSSRLCV
ncbi:hypothetical protein J6590_100259, partial [Homalodisca vitripennis]